MWQHPKVLWNDGDRRAAFCEQLGDRVCDRLPSSLRMIFRLKAEATRVPATFRLKAEATGRARYFQRTLSSNDTLIFASGPGVTGIGLPSF